MAVVSCSYVLSVGLGWLAAPGRVMDGREQGTKCKIGQAPFFSLLFSRDCNLKISKLTFSGGNGDSQKTKSLFHFHVSSETHYIVVVRLPSPGTHSATRPKYGALLPSSHHHYIAHS